GIIHFFFYHGIQSSFYSHLFWLFLLHFLFVFLWRRIFFTDYPAYFHFFITSFFFNMMFDFSFIHRYFYRSYCFPELLNFSNNWFVFFDYNGFQSILNNLWNIRFFLLNWFLWFLLCRL